MSNSPKKISQAVVTSGQNNTGRQYPVALKSYDAWLVTRDKRPIVPSEKWQYTENLLSFDRAQALSEQLDGKLAFCFNEGGPFIGFDLDHVSDSGGEFTQEALGVVRAVGSYTEVSSSGTGLHIIAEGERLRNRKTRAELSEQGHLEVYDANRYFVLTGDLFGGYTSVKERHTAAKMVQIEHLPRDKPSPATGHTKPEEEGRFEQKSTAATPERVLRTIKAYAENEKYQVDQEVLRLWQGSDEGRESPSEADMAFVSQLYYWCKGDRQLMDKCFRVSNRMRNKWDEVHSADGKTYGEMTIKQACRSSGEVFQGRYVR